MDMLWETPLQPDSSILPCRRRVGGLPRRDVDAEDMAQNKVGQMLRSSDVKDKKYVAAIRSGSGNHRAYRLLYSMVEASSACEACGEST